MRVFFLRAILGLALLPCAGRAQFSFIDLVPARRQIQATETPARPPGSYLGLNLTDVDGERAKVLKLGESRGVEVRSVEEGSPADSAGIQPGDVLLSYNGENIVGAQQLIRLVQETPSGRKIKVQFWRDGKQRFALLTTGSPPRPGMNASLAGFPDVPVAILAWRNMLAGLEFEELDSQLSDYFGVPGGMLIRGVEKGSPADKCGLKPGDVIVSVRHKSVWTAHDFTSCLRKPGAPASLTLVRNHKKLDLLLTLPGSEQ